MEIKFDAILIATWEHFTPIDINFEDNTLTASLNGVSIKTYSFSTDGNSGEVVLRQYTGGRDIKYKDVYAGDILRDKRGNMYYIIFADMSFRAMYKDGYCYKYFFDDEIIGNIYTSPDTISW
ncbi:YopX family protein [Paenibacillus pabuli]|uniref:YopX family protein n=1 Tax=Paenibacillus pabuli TaxID=1472 RepID=UPI0032424D6A